MKLLPLLLALLAIPFSAEGANLLRLPVGSPIEVAKALRLTNSMYEHHARGHYLDQSFFYQIRWNARGRALNQCNLQIDLPNTKARGTAPALTILPGSKIRTTGLVQADGYEEKRMRTYPHWRDGAVYREEKTGNFLEIWSVPVEVESDRGRFSGILDCEFSLQERPRGTLSSSHLGRVSQGALRLR